MRLAIVALGALAGCTAPNPSYDPRYYARLFQPDLYGFIPAPDMTVLPDLIVPDLTPPPDLLPPPDLTCGLPFDNKNCGKCGNACAGGTACSMGACVACVSDCSDPGATLWKVCCPDSKYLENSAFACATDQNVCAPCGFAGERCCPNGSCGSGINLRCVDGFCR
jgi:hypothetical protein